MKDPIQLYSLSEGLAKVMLVLVLQQSPSEGISCVNGHDVHIATLVSQF